LTKKASWTWIAVLLLALAAAYQVWKHVPPFERGSHDSVVQAETNPAHADAPHIGPCPLFPADNVWNTAVDSLPVDKRSNDYIGSIGPLHGVHPDFGFNLNSGIPYTLLPASGARSVRVNFDYRDESDLGNYPIPPDAPIEGGAQGNGDRHVIVVDPRTCLLYEIDEAQPQADGTWKALSGIRVDLTDNALRTAGKTSADAAGLPILPGLVRYDEVEAGAINHALRFTIPHTQNIYIWPARHKASNSADPTIAPMGARFRLRADFDISKYSKTNQIIMKCLKKYGLILADNGSAMFISGVSDRRWDDSDLHKLGDIKAQDFEVVDESDLQLLPDSGRVDPRSIKH
jgi:hypothetical protein